jgi:hypothetical protein
MVLNLSAHFPPGARPTSDVDAFSSLSADRETNVNGRLIHRWVAVCAALTLPYMPAFAAGVFLNDVVSCSLVQDGIQRRIAGGEGIYTATLNSLDVTSLPCSERTFNSTGAGFADIANGVLHVAASMPNHPASTRGTRSVDAAINDSLSAAQLFRDGILVGPSSYRLDVTFTGTLQGAVDTFSASADIRANGIIEHLDFNNLFGGILGDFTHSFSGVFLTSGFDDLPIGFSIVLSAVAGDLGGFGPSVGAAEISAQFAVTPLDGANPLRSESGVFLTGGSSAAVSEPPPLSTMLLGVAMLLFMTLRCRSSPLKAWWPLARRR